MQKPTSLAAQGTPDGTLHGCWSMSACVSRLRYFPLRINADNQARYCNSVDGRGGKYDGDGGNSYCDRKNPKRLNQDTSVPARFCLDDGQHLLPDGQHLSELSDRKHPTVAHTRIFGKGTGSRSIFASRPRKGVSDRLRAGWPAKADFNFQCFPDVARSEKFDRSVRYLL